MGFFSGVSFSSAFGAGLGSAFGAGLGSAFSFVFCGASIANFSFGFCCNLIINFDAFFLSDTDISLLVINFANSY